MKRKALGRGLRSLIPEVPPAAVASAALRTSENVPFRLIDIDRIVPNRDQPRKDFELGGLEELARSVQAQGVLQPVIVRPAAADGTHELIAGERRWRAAQTAGLLKIPAVVRDIEDARLLEMALVENLQRENLNPIDEASAYQALGDDLGKTQEEIAEIVGKNRATVANALRLLGLPAQVQARVRSGELSAGHAKALAAMTSTTAQIELSDRIVRDGLSVRAVEALVQRSGSRPRRAPRAAAATDPNVVAAQDALQKTLGTKVRIVQGASRAGRIELYFYSDEELDRLYQIVIRHAKTAK